MGTQANAPDTPSGRGAPSLAPAGGSPPPGDLSSAASPTGSSAGSFSAESGDGADGNPTRTGSSLAAGFRLFLFLLVFGGFPVAVVQIAVRQVEQVEVAKLIQADRLQQERLLSRLRDADDEPQMVRRSVIRVFDRLRETPDPTARRRLVAHLHRLFPGHFDLFLFDVQGKVMTELSSGRYPRRAMESAFGALVLSAAGKTADPGHVGILKSVLNIPSLLAAHKQQRVLVRLGGRDLDSHLLWNRFATASSTAPAAILALIHQSRFTPDRALRASLQLLRKRLRRGEVGRFEMGDRQVVIDPTAFNSLPDLRSRLIVALSQYERHFEGDGYHGTFSPRKSRGYLLSVLPRPRFLPPPVGFAIDLLCGIWILLVLRQTPWRGKGFSGRIPAKLTALFLFAIGTPTVVLLVGGFYALKDHENVLRQSLETRMREKIREFDERLPIETNLLQDWIAELIRQSRQETDLASQARVFTRIRQKPEIEYAYVIDRQGKAFFVHEPNAMLSTRERTQKLMLLMGREMLNRLNKSMKVDSGALMVEATENLFSTLVGGEGAFDLEYIIRDMGRFINLTLGAESSNVLVDALYNKAGEAQFALVAVLNRARFERDYIKTHVDSLIRQPDLEWRVHAFGEVPHVGRVITDRKREEEVVKVAQEVLANKAAVRRLVATGTTEELWYAQKGANLPLFVLVAHAPLTHVQERVRTLWWFLVIIAGMVFISTSFIGLLLSEQLLKPIGDLTMGVRSIDNRKFDVRIPIHAEDELGNLSRLMNQVLEGMKDLEVARIVQENLFPQTPLTAPGCRIYGRSRAMADIGGDYFDYFLVGNRLVGLVGDVSGHGVSAALIMGMAKCAFSMDENIRRGLLEVLDSFNRFLIATVKRKKMMTMFLYALDLETFRLEYINAGHNFPFLWRNRTQAVEQLSQESFPLGIRAKATYKILTTTLDWGDTLMLYTDGLVESPDHTGAMIGYENAAAWFAQAAHLDPVEIIDRLFARFDDAVQNRPPVDDISLICLKRQ